MEDIHTYNSRKVAEALGVGDFNPYLDRDPHDFRTFEQPSLLARLKAVLAAPAKIKGIDVSHWNGDIDWKLVKASGIDFAMIKATEGTGWKDSKWEYNWRAALDHEIIVTPYHFFRDQYKGNPQLSWFLENTEDYLQEVDGKTIVWADVETDNGSGITARQNRLYGFCSNAVGKGLQAGYYSSKSKWGTLIGNPIWANDFHQWVASWTPNSTYVLPTGWTEEKCKFWQFGIYPTYPWAFPVEGAGRVDVNWFLGTIQELRDILGVTSIPADCCEDIKLRMDLLDAEILFVKGELGTLNQRAELGEQERIQIWSELNAINEIRYEIGKLLE